MGVTPLQAPLGLHHEGDTPESSSCNQCISTLMGTDEPALTPVCGQPIGVSPVLWAGF